MYLMLINASFALRFVDAYPFYNLILLRMCATASDSRNDLLGYYFKMQNLINVMACMF
jgi:hypothetical protein